LLTQSVGCDIEDDILEEILVCCLSLIGWKMIVDACAPRRSELVYIYIVRVPLIGLRLNMNIPCILPVGLKWIRIDGVRAPQRVDVDINDIICVSCA
jgi:hypothetical protein